MYKINKHYVSKPQEKSGCDLCCFNIHIGETYYTIENDTEIILIYCDMCKKELIKKIMEA